MADLRFCGHQSPYLAEIHVNDDVCGHQGPYLVQMPFIYHDTCIIRASVSG